MQLKNDFSVKWFRTFLCSAQSRTDFITGNMGLYCLGSNGAHVQSIASKLGWGEGKDGSLWGVGDPITN